MFGYLDAVREPMQPWDLERVRRSIVMLAPRHRGAIGEAAMALLEELQRLQSKDRRMVRLLDEVAGLVDAPVRPTTEQAVEDVRSHTASSAG